MRWVTVYGLALPVLVTGLAWALRRRVSQMTAMVLAMSLGTATGLWAGAAAVVLGLGDLWGATLLGAGVGAAFGTGAGLAGGLSGALDGGLGGVMGGTMGAMLAAMVPGRAAAALRVSAALLGAVAVLAVWLLERDAGVRELRSAFRSRCLLLAAVLVAGLVLGALTGAI